MALLNLIFSGIPEIDSDNFTPFSPFSLSGIAEATALLFFAFTGYARIATLAEEVKDPEITIPKAVIHTIVSAIILYAAVSLVAIGVIGVIGAENMAGSKSPLQLESQSLNTPGIKLVVTLGASTARLGVLLSQILGISRMMFAMGRRKDLPSVLQKIHPKNGVPHIGIFITGFIILFLCIVGTFEFILAPAAFTILLYYNITNISAIKQPKNERRYGLVVPVLGLLGCLLMALSLDIQIIISGLILMAIGFVVRFIIHKIKA